MRTLRSEWEEFYSSNSTTLQNHYPGLNLHRFLLEVEDLLILRTKNLDLVLEDADISVSERTSYMLKQDLLRGIPFAYLLGFTEFYGRQFYINENVLIPRQETELLVDMIVKHTKVVKSPYKNALDVGTGSGIILQSLLMAGAALKGVGVDISPEALKVAQVNAQRHRLNDRSRYILGDRFSGVSGSYDLIVSNPPYIKETTHRHLVHLGVINFEPHVALFISDDTYVDWFEDFFTGVKRHLSPGGHFIMEGHELELDQQGLMLKALGFKEIKLLRDFSGQLRFLKAEI